MRRRAAPPRPQPHPLFALAALSSALLHAAHAQQPLPDVEVIGVSPIPGVDLPRDQIPANVQTAKSTDLERTQSLDLASYLNRRMGSVFVNEIQNNPFQPDVSFRGYTASPLLGTQQGLSLYMDGVRLNQPFGDVVSWDLVPKSAISSIALNPGSNPLFGLNTLGGALVVTTKDGLRNPGTSIQGQYGTYDRKAAGFEHGGSNADGVHWFVTGNLHRERGWRTESHAEVGQLFGKIGKRSADLDVSLSAVAADTDLNGNGLQEKSFLERDYSSAYTLYDNTKNRSLLLNLAMTKSVNDRWRVGGNAYYRRIRTKTYNGDINDDSLDQSVYQPDAAERLALTGAGYAGFPMAGESAANTPFPKWRCIANALRRDEPAEKCNGVINRTETAQSNFGFGAQASFDGTLAGIPSTSLIGTQVDWSRSHFTQGSELGYLNPDRSVTGVGAFGDGVNGGEVDGEPYDTRVDLTGRTRTYSLFASSILGVADRTYLTLSGRYDRSSVRNRDAITPGGGTGSLDGDHTFSRFNPAVGLNFAPGDGIGGWAGISQGSRAPSSIELGCADPASPCKLPNSFAGDPPLKQVVTTTVEAGLRGGRPGGIAWSAGVFRSDNDDDLLFVSDTVTGFGYFRNFGKTRRQGVELALNVQPAKNLAVGANFTYLDATFRSAEVVNGSSNSSNQAAAAGFPGVEGTIDIRPGDRIPLIPTRMLKLYADLDIGNAWFLGADVVAIGGSIARGNENGRHKPDGVYYLGEGRSPGYAVLNVQAAYRPSKGAQVFVQMNNVLDRRYSTAAQLGPMGFDAAGNFQARPFPADANGDRPLRHSTFYAPGAPRTFVAGVKYSF